MSSQRLILADFACNYRRFGAGNEQALEVADL
jgi:hypothetical protein